MGTERIEALDFLLSDLDQLVKNRSWKGRTKTFKQVVELYFASIHLQEDEHVEFFGDVLGLLVEHVETKELAELGQRIAPVKRAPAKLISAARQRRRNRCGGAGDYAIWSTFL